MLNVLLTSFIVEVVGNLHFSNSFDGTTVPKFFSMFAEISCDRHSITTVLLGEGQLLVASRGQG